MIFIKVSRRAINFIFFPREAKRCEFHVKASSSEEEFNATTVNVRGRRGRLHAPTHTLPPNTTCTWTFHGRPGNN